MSDLPKAAPTDSRLLAQYPKQQIVRDRNYVGLSNWASYISARPVPPEKPDAAWVKETITAARIPQQIDNYVLRTLSYFIQDPNTQANIRAYLNEWADEAAETSLSAQIEGVISAFMPRFVEVDVNQSEVDTWYVQHGFAEPPVTQGIPGPTTTPMQGPKTTPPAPPGPAPTLIASPSSGAAAGKAAPAQVQWPQREPMPGFSAQQQKR